MVLTTIAGMAGISFAVFVLQILEKAANDPGVIKPTTRFHSGLAIGTYPPHRIGIACRTGTCLSRHGNQSQLKPSGMNKLIETTNRKP